MLLFWPCSWSLAYSYSFSQDLEIFLQYLILFLLGSILMRSAGCIFNDIADKDFDIKVKRTKNRPIASGRIKTNHAFIYVILLCGLAFIILLLITSPPPTPVPIITPKTISCSIPAPS